MVYADLSNSAIAVPAGSAVEVTLTERSVMVADRTESGLSASTPLEAHGARALTGAGFGGQGEARPRRLITLLGVARGTHLADCRPQFCLGTRRPRSDDRSDLRFST